MVAPNAPDMHPLMLSHSFPTIVGHAFGLPIWFFGQKMHRIARNRRALDHAPIAIREKHIWSGIALNWPGAAASSYARPAQCRFCRSYGPYLYISKEICRLPSPVFLDSPLRRFTMKLRLVVSKLPA